MQSNRHIVQEKHHGPVFVHTGLKLCAHIDVPGCVNFYFLFIKSWLFELPGMDHIVRMVFYSSKNCALGK